MRSLFQVIFIAVIVIMPPIVQAEQKTVSPGETVTVGSSEIASWASADIDIGEGATLCFSEPDSAATFTGRITGSGNFVANASPGGVVPKVFTMDGDAAAFTGGFFFTNVIARIQKPLAVGDIAGITVYSPYDTGASARSYLWGAKGSDGATYVYRNRLDIHVGAHNGMVIDQRAEAAGDIVHRAGVFNGPGRITGRIETYSTALYLMDEIHVEGKVVAHASGAKILNNGTVVHFGGQTRDVAYFQAFDCTRPVHLTGDNLFGANVQLQLGSSFNDEKKSGRLELNGHSQLFGSVAEIPANNYVNVGGIGNSGAPAAVTVADQKKAAWFRGRLDGNLSVAVSGESQLGFVGYENTMNGTITADAGKIKLEYLWPKIKSLVCRNGGFIDFGAPSDTNPQGTIINPKATIDIDGTSKIKVQTGLTLTIRRLIINGSDVRPGKYHKNSPEVAGRLDTFGNGFLQVTGMPGCTMLIK